MMRLNKYLSQSGLFSRRQADEAIAAGEVVVDDVRAVLGQQVDPDKDVVKYQGKIIRLISELIYYALYKPIGVISTASDELGRKTVLDFVPKHPRVYPVGRLDEDSEGLMVLTNDGELTQKLTHPGFEHEKEYLVKARIKPHVLSIRENTDRKIISSFTKGLMIDGKLMKADKAYNFRNTSNLRLLTFNLTLHTGYNRQIRKMCDKIGLEVIWLTRFRIGKLRLFDLKLKPGEYKQVDRADIM